MGAMLPLVLLFHLVFSTQARSGTENEHVSFGDVATCTPPHCNDFVISEAQVLASLVGFTTHNGGSLTKDTTNYFGDFWIAFGADKAVPLDYCTTGAGSTQTSQTKPYTGVTFAATTGTWTLGTTSTPPQDCENYCSAVGTRTPDLLGTTFGVNYTKVFSRKPSSKSRADIANAVGYAVDGVAIFSPKTRNSKVAVYGEALDTCSGQSENGLYHYHGFSTCLHSESGTQNGSSIPHSKIYGWAFDGFPIYGPYGYTDGANSSTVVRVTGGYSCTSSGAACSTDAQKAVPSNWAYSSSAGMLDDCNGRWTKTPEFPEGMYVYVLNIQSTGAPDFPGVPYCLQSSAFGGGTTYNMHANFGDVATCTPPQCNDFTITEADILASLVGFTTHAGAELATYRTTGNTIKYYGKFWIAFGADKEVPSDYCSAGAGVNQTNDPLAYTGVTYSAGIGTWMLGTASTPARDCEDYCSAVGAKTPDRMGTTFGSSYIKLFSLSPSSKSRTDISDVVGYAVDGVVIFSPYTAYGDCKVWCHTSKIAAYDESLDTCNGHPSNGLYHYHGFSPCVHSESGLQTGASIPHSKIYGWANDGFPIYGPYGYSDGNQMTSAVVRITGGYACYGCGAAEKAIPSNWGWSSGNGMLDECNGRWTRTKEFPQGMYVYVLNVQQNGKPDFPGVPYCVQSLAAASKDRVVATEIRIGNLDYDKVMAHTSFANKLVIETQLAILQEVNSDKDVGTNYTRLSVEVSLRKGSVVAVAKVTPTSVYARGGLQKRLEVRTKALAAGLLKRVLLISGVEQMCTAGKTPAHLTATATEPVITHSASPPGAAMVSTAVTSSIGVGGLAAFLVMQLLFLSLGLEL